VGWAEFDKQVRETLAAKEIKNPTPQQFVSVAKELWFPCRRCGGTGRFITGMHNGRLVGPGGPCFRCEGRGSQNWVDGRRNAYHDEKHAAKQLAAMCR
jgi:hypothetical protein